MRLGLRIAIRSLAPGLLVVLTLAIGEAGAANPVGKWLGQDGHDLVGGEPGPSKNDYQDVHIAVKGLPANREVAEVIIRGDGGGEWKTANKDRFTVLVVRQPRSIGADLYFEPDKRETGRQFEIKLKLDDGQEATIYVQGGKADPNLRAPGTGIEAKWLGQDGQDRVGPTAGVGPDGVEDVHVALSKVSAKAEIKGVDITGPGGLAWHAGLNPKGLASAELVRGDDKTRADLYFATPRDLAGQTLKVTVAYGFDRADSTSVVAAKSNPARPAAKAKAVDPPTSKATARWLGQDGIQTAPGDVHVEIDGLSANRPIAAAALSDGVVATWVFKPNDGVRFDAGGNPERLNVRRTSSTKADLAFPPVRDESGATMTLRLVDPSGREEVLRFPGGPGDPDRRAPALPTGTVAAKPGDDLQALVARGGTIRIAKGVYPLARPLILAKPVRLVGEAGSILRFRQSKDDAPWTAAIKVHAGGTGLEGFAVRFDGPTRWDRAVSYGASVIGSTDDRDPDPRDPKFGISLTKLDLEGPAASTDWEEAVHLIRLASAASGRIADNTLKGGAVVFGGGPWKITGNVHKGTLPKTFCYEVFSARWVHDLTFVGNKATVEGPSGKSWRFLILAQRGAHDLIKDNVVGGGVGPREDDKIQHSNTPEVILTEAYRLHYEGKPAAISPDGWVVVIHNPQGGEAGTGDALAILSGPQAGQWRTIAQPLGPRTYLLDEPIARETDAVSIATGFVRETFEHNVIDCRGSGIASDFVLAGNHFGTKVIGNTFLGGGESIRLMAAPTETPVHWGWSHAPFLGAQIEGNTFEDAVGGTIGVEHSGAIRANKGRVYMSLTFKGNTLRSSKPPSGSAGSPKLAIGYAPSLDPGELVIVEEGTKIEGADARSIWVRAATINGKAVEGAPLTGKGSTSSKAVRARSSGATRRN